MRALLPALFLLAALAPFAAEARSRKSPVRDPRTQGLGRSCKKSSDCGKAQRCLKLSDMNGKPQDGGFCVLPCAAIDAGTTKVIPGQPLDPEQAKKASKKKPAPPRCPPRYQCHGQDASTPIDICVAG